MARNFCLAGLLAIVLTAPAAAQDPPEADPEKPKGRPANADGYDAYVLPSEVTYVPPGKDGSGQGILLKFDLRDDVPRGTIIRLTLDRFGLPVDGEEITYTLKDENRKGLSLNWKLKSKQVVGEYGIRSHIELEKQTPAVQGLFKQLEKTFPAKENPWSWYVKPQGEFFLGTPEEEKAEAADVCEVFTQHLDGLLELMSEFKDKMDEALNGEGMVQGGRLDAAKLESYVKEWRGKIAAAQKKVAEFGGHPLAARQPAAYRQLRTFGVMIAKRCTLLQKEVADKFKSADPNPKVKGFDKAHNGPVEAKNLQTTYDNIRSIVGCPAEEEEAPADEAAAGEAEAKPEDGANPEAPPEEAPEPEPEPEGKPKGGGKPKAESQPKAGSKPGAGKKAGSK